MARRTSYRRANVQVTESDFLPVMVERLKKLAEKEVHIGMQGDAELAMIAGVHEYGSTKMKIPARSFIGTGKRKAQAAIGKLVRAGVKDIATGSKRPDALYEEIGNVGQEKVLKNFDKIRQPGLSILYARRKTSRKILVQEKKLRDSITFIVVPRGGR